MEDTPDDLERRLDELAPEARQRVESMLKDMVERELANEAVDVLRDVAAGHEKTEHEKTKHDKTTPKVQASDIRELNAIDDAAFEMFTERLVRLKEISGQDP
jgi:hypothetical protein